MTGWVVVRRDGNITGYWRDDMPYISCASCGKEIESEYDIICDRCFDEEDPMRLSDIYEEINNFADEWKHYRVLERYDVQ